MCNPRDTWKTSHFAEYNSLFILQANILKMHCSDSGSGSCSSSYKIDNFLITAKRSHCDSFNSTLGTTDTSATAGSSTSNNC